MCKFLPKLWVCAFAFLVFPLGVNALTAEQIYKKVSGSVYTLYSFDYQTRHVKARGSAVAIKRDILATNCHVALSGDYLVAKINNKPRVARLFFKNERQDLCLVEIPNANFKPVVIRASDTVNIGEVVYAIGNPKGTEKSLSKGIISNKHKVRGGIWLQTDAAIYYGSSGGGLFDEEGRLIGITTKMGGNFGFAIPTEWIIQVMSPSASKAQAENESDAQTQLEKPDHSHAYAGLTKLGSYGEQGVGLYRNNRECFIFIPGRTDSDKIVSATLWNPKYPRTMVIFPAAKTAKEAMVAVYKAVVDKKVKKQSTYKSGSVLHLNSHEYPLYGTKSETEIYGFLVVRFAKSPVDMLNRIGQFEVQLKEAGAAQTERVQFNMNGFKEAVEDYKNKCQ